MPEWTKEVKECRECKGKGEVTRMRPHSGTPYVWPCDTCQGRGSQERFVPVMRSNRQ